MENCIRSTVEQLRKNTKDLNTPMEIFLKYNNKKISISRWNYTYYIVSDLMTENKLTEATYRLATLGIHDICTGELTCFIEKNNYYINTEHKLFTMKESQEYLNFLENFHKRIKDRKICSLYIRFCKLPEKEYKTDQERINSLTYCHANMLFIENKEDVINLYLYDPHGSSPYHKYAREGFIFIYNLATSYNTKYGKPMNIIKRETFSCPKGIQGVIPEIKENKIGYCIIYSYFWLYLILHCISMIPNIDLNTLISTIEKTVLKLVPEPESLAKLIYNFTENIVSTVQTYMPGREKYFENLHANILRRVLKNNPDILNTAVPIELHRIRKGDITTGYTVSSKQHDRTGPCLKNDDCLSHCCSKITGKCKERDYNKEDDAECMPEKEDIQEEEDDVFEKERNIDSFVTQELKDFSDKIKKLYTGLYISRKNNDTESEKSILKSLQTVNINFKLFLQLLRLEGFSKEAELISTAITKLVDKLHGKG